MKMLSGVSTTLSAAHRDRTTGQIHGHSYEITAWFKFTNTDISILQYVLEQMTKRFDHTVLPDALAWAENLAQHIGLALQQEGQPVVQVDADRPVERLKARWIA